MSKTRHSTGSSKKSTKRVTSDAVEILDQMIGKDHELREMVEEATVNAMVAQVIYDARTQANLTQAELADLIGTKQTVISRLEDADYDGHSLSTLRRIAEALGKRLEVRFVDARLRESA